MTVNITRVTGCILAGYLLIAMHIHWPNRGGSGFYLPWNMVGIIVMMLVIIITMRFSGSPLFSSRLFSALLVGGVILLLPALWSAEPWLSEVMPRQLGLLSGILLYFALLQIPLDHRWRQRLLLLLLTAVFIEAILGLVQYILLQNYSGSWMGFDTNYTRPYGIFQQVNVMASFMASGLALALCLLGRRQTKGRISQGLIAGVLVLAPLLLMMILSRVGLLAAILLTPLQLIILWRSHPRRMMYALALIASGVLCGVVLMLLNGAAREVTSAAPVLYRLIYWQEALRMIAERPWLGWGYGHFEHDFINHFNINYNIESVSHPHNELLYWGVEGGLLSLTGIAVITWGGWLLLRRMRPRLLRPGVWLATLPILLHMMLEYPLYQSAAHAVMLLLLLRVCDVRRQNEMPLQIQPLLRIGISAIAALLMLYMLNGLHSSLIITAVEKTGLQQFDAMSKVMTPTPWQARYDFDVQLHQMMNYSQTQDPEILQGYQRWAENEIRVRPDANTYFNLIQISRVLNQLTRAAQLKRQAQKLYPQDSRFW